MKRIIYFLPVILIFGLFGQCKKGKKDKLKNPFGLLALGSDTSLPDGKYVIRTMNGCGGWASTLRCDYIDGAIGVNGSLNAIDHISHLNIDSSEVWYVKKVRYISPDPDYALAFGYRIYQRMPNGRYRFLAFTATGSASQWPDDEIGFTYGDGRSHSVKADPTYNDRYPSDPPVPTSFATDNDPLPKVDTRYLFQFYASEENQGFFRIKAGGRRTELAGPTGDRWNFCMAYWNNQECDVSNIYPHFRGDDPKCEGWQEGGVNSRRCYIRDFYFQKVY
jgi:hypothetical protein